MNTPICDFVRRYAESDTLRLHMPGHKGVASAFDITEVEGADSLYEAGGIIRESEENAGQLFGARTFYSTEGSSQCIRAMLYLVCLYAKQAGKRPLIAAGRNAHKSFLSGAALLDLDVMWLCPERPESYLSCKIDGPWLERMLENAQETPAAVYLTSPDYLGQVLDIRELAEVCHRRGILLLVDNAHGAYLKFLPGSRHPIDLGADMCCDSAHKTLPVLTGGAYLHVARPHVEASGRQRESAPERREMWETWGHEGYEEQLETAREAFAVQAKRALALFGSTSPSYLILQSLDGANRYLAQGYRERLSEFCGRLDRLKEKLRVGGYVLWADEPLKITIAAKAYGYRGRELADLLLEKNIVCEFSDPDFLVMMLTPETGEDGLLKLEKTLLSIPRKAEIAESAPEFHLPEQVMSVRDAYFSVNETVKASESAGRVLAVATVGCPPAVPIVVGGERIDEVAVKCFSYYGIDECTVVR